MDAALIAHMGARLRRARVILAAMPQADVIAVLAEFGHRWRDSGDPFRREAEALTRPFPFAMVRLSLDALLASLTPDALWGLVDGEGVRDSCGPPLVGHVIAGNTPLLAWTSLLRALLMRSASLVKLPSGDAAEWGRLFHRSLSVVSPALASSIGLAEWPGGQADTERALCESVDLVLAYGSDRTIKALQALCPCRTPFVGYGHRVSFGVVRAGADADEAGRGFATDVLLYDQGGCLSPQTIFVEGGERQAQEFAARLAIALAAAVPSFPLPHRMPGAAARVREARLLARMEAGTRLWEDTGLRWTVIARPPGVFAPSPTHGVVSVQPFSTASDLAAAIAPVRNSLQGCALAPGDPPPPPDWWPAGGVSYLCRPGRLQAPPLSWPQDGHPVLRSLRSGGSGSGLAGAKCGE